VTEQSYSSAGKNNAILRIYKNNDDNGGEINVPEDNDDDNDDDKKKVVSLRLEWQVNRLFNV
jgi:hypothetical protein